MNWLPALNFDPSSGIFIGDFFGFIIALPISLFLAFWISSVKHWQPVVIGAFVGALLGFFIILGWVGTLIFDTPLPNANPAAVFFSAIFICAALGLSGGILVDLLVGRARSNDYRRQHALEE
jgi:hypothetical protein